MISQRVVLLSTNTRLRCPRQSKQQILHPGSTTTHLDHDITVSLSSLFFVAGLTEFALNSTTILLDSCSVPTLNILHEKKVKTEEETVKIEEISSYKRARSPEDLAEVSAQRPAKRLAVSANAPPNSPQVEEPRRTRDGEYYYERNWVIVVRNTLFKLPRFLFLRHCSGVRELFQLPADKDISSINERDILQVDEDVEDFRALSWGLTADPEEITHQNDPLKANFERMLRLLYMAQKYTFVKHERWANEAVNTLCKALISRPLDEIKRILSLSAKRNLGGVLKATTTECIRRLASRDSDISSKEMLDFAESHNLRRLQGWVLLESGKPGAQLLSPR
ncbi:unnamed protein product [Cyclocybe aegerita]|uniref:BTB/POZ domain-containing protein n=1 Tax=Cyclocybe aegerita TaxID=1973307 RepID=A0A8S0WZM1_CYCAE|nr:unnamed protein product [Cyclocybe aegerita]